MGLEILYARPGPQDRLEGVAKRALTKELRERYWIRQAAEAGIGGKSWATWEVTFPWSIERAELGRNRNEPGDGFRYVFRNGTEGTSERVEWFEVTEEFEGVKAKEIESFMRLQNGLEADAEFDPEGFLGGLNLGIPRRAAQRRAADKVIAAAEQKLAKSSYQGMWRNHGYGTLIVGLPLWFATNPLDPLRVKNVIDDFTTRVQIGLEPLVRQMRRRSCPFWRIVVVWPGSVESIREWTHKARLEVYEDPAYHRIGSFPVPEGWELHLLKLGEESTSAVAESSQRLTEFAETHREGLLARLRSGARRRYLEVLCFVRVHGIGGLERWIVARLSPRRRVAHFAMRRRALRLYRASRRR